MVGYLTNKTVTTFIRNACWAFTPFRSQVPRKSPSRTSAHPTFLNTNQGVVSAITVFGVRGRCRGGGQMSDNRCCLGMRACRDKISCPVWQLSGGCIQCRGMGTAPDSKLTGLHLPPTATGRQSGKQDTRRRSEAVGTGCGYYLPRQSVRTSETARLSR